MRETRSFIYAQMPDKKNKKKSKRPADVPREIHVEYLEPSDELADKEEIERLFAEEIEEKRKDNEYYQSFNYPAFN